MSQLIKYSIYILVSISLIACGGGGGQDGTGRPPSNERQVTSVGTITSDDTLTVNGVEYDTSNATVTIDNEPGTEDELELGQIVVVNGTLDESGETGTAESISFNTNVLGPVSSLSPADNVELNDSFVVLGQTINVTPETIYAGSRFENSEIPIENNRDGFDSINVDDNLRIVGFISAEDELVASYIESITISAGEIPGEGDNPFYEVNGPISNLDITARTFNINDLVVDYSDLINVEQLENGILVEVLGSEVSDGTLLASSIAVTSEDIAEVDTRLELEGFITVFDSAQSFEINGLRIESDINTEIVGGTIENISLNKRIEIEGEIDGDGILVAERIIILASYLTSHQYGERLESRSTTLTWANVNADEYRLTILGEGYVFFDQSFDSQTFSVNVDDLPFSGAPLAVTLYTRQGDLWLSEFYYLLSVNYGTEIARLISHVSGDVLDSSQVTFEWTDVEADEYRLTIRNGSDYGHDEMYSEFYDMTYDRFISSSTISGLPSTGVNLQLSLSTRRGLIWRNENYILVSSGEPPIGAEILSHNNGEVLDDSSIELVWSDVDAYAYRLELYSGGGSSFRTYSINGDDTSILIDNLPRNNADIDFQLTTIWPDGSHSNTELNLISQSGLPNSQLLSHASDDILDSSSADFRWENVNADAYRLQIYNAESSDPNEELIFDSFETDTFSITVNQLPIDGRDLRVILSTLHGSGWARQEYFLTSATMALEAAILTSHLDNAVLTSSSVRFEWSNTNADNYELMIYRQDGSVVVDDSFSRYTQSVVINNLPITGESLTLRLISRFGSQYLQNNYHLKSSYGGAIVGTDNGDRLLGGSGDDYLHGFDGDDEFFGGGGNDSLYGGAGDDNYYINLDGGSTFIREHLSIDGDPGSDTVLFGFGISPDAISLERIQYGLDSNHLLITIESTGQTIIILGFYGLTAVYDDGSEIEGLGYVESFQFADGTVWDINTILSNAENTIGTEDDDILTGRLVEGLGGDDNIIGGFGDDTLDGGSGNDVIDGREGNDTIITGSGDDIIYGRGGDDTIIVDSLVGDNTRIFGGVGSNSYRYSSNAGNVVIDNSELRDPDYGNNQLFLEGNITISDIRLERNLWDIIVTIPSTGSTITLVDSYTGSRFFTPLDRINFSDGTSLDAVTFSSMAVPVE